MSPDQAFGAAAGLVPSAATDRPRRTYDATGRRAAAEQRRDRVVATAGRMFAERGWAGTTLAAVAREAGVSAETITKGIGGKPELLMAAMRAASFGRPGGLATAFADLRLEDEPDRSARIDRVVDFAAGSIARMAPFVPVIVQAADRDERMRAVLAAAEQGHLETTRLLVSAVADGPVAPDAVDEVYVLTRAETYLTLVEHRGWTTERYRDWLRRSIEAAVTR